MQRLLDDRWLLFPVLVFAVVIAVGSTLIIVLSGDESGGTQGSAPTSDVVAGDATTIDISDFTFKPETLTVKVGAKVTWVNRDVAPHTATASGAFDTGNLKKNDQKTLILDRAGTYPYICEFHPFMKATVIVR